MGSEELRLFDGVTASFPFMCIGSWRKNTDGAFSQLMGRQVGLMIIPPCPISTKGCLLNLAYLGHLTMPDGRCEVFVDFPHIVQQGRVGDLFNLFVEEPQFACDVSSILGHTQRVA